MATGRGTIGRRTQQQRRAATIGKLIDATISAIAEVGYVRTSVQEICVRAGLSHGGLFRHFDTRLDLIVAAAAEVGRRQIGGFADRFADLPADREQLGSALRLVRERSREPVNAVWHELLVAARTDAELRDRLGPTIAGYREAVFAEASRLPGMAAVPAEVREALLFTVLYVFDGETLTRHVAPDEVEEECRLRLVERCMVRIATG